MARRCVNNRGRQMPCGKNFMALEAMGLGNYRGASYSAEAQAYFNALPTQPSASEKNIDATLIDALVEENIFTEVDRLVLCANGERVNAVVSVPNPTSDVAIETGALKWNEWGFVGDTNAYLRSQYAPSVDGVNYTKNSACFFYWSLTDLNQDSVDMGCFSSTPTPDRNALCFSNSSGVLYSCINDITGGGTTIANTSTLGLFSIVRDASNSIKVYKNGVLIKTGAQVSSELPDIEFFICGCNLNGALEYPSTRQIALYGTCSGDVDQSVLYSKLNDYITSIQALYPSPSPAAVAPMDDPILKLSIPSLLDESGNGWNSTLGADLIGGFTAPTIDADDNLVFNGNNTVKLSTSFGLTPLRVHTEFMAIYTETPELTQGLLNVGLQYICGMRVAAYTRDDNKWVNIGGVYYDEGAATEPVWGRSIPKLQAGYNIIGFSFSATRTIMYCNGQITYFTPNCPYGAVGTSGWIGGFPSGPDAAYTLPAYYKIVANSFIQVFNYAGNTGQMLSTGNSILQDIGCSAIVFEGDSITQGFTLATNAENWTSIVVEDLLANTSHKWAACNIGIGARTLDSMANTCGTIGASVPFNKIATVSVNPISKSDYASAKNIYVLFAGINDIAASATLGAMQTDFTTLINYRNSQGFDCYVVSVTSDVALTAPQEAVRLAYNAWLATQIGTLNFTFIDICSNVNLAGQPSGANAYFSDGVHFTALTCSSIVAPMVYSSIISNY